MHRGASRRPGPRGPPPAAAGVLILGPIVGLAGLGLVAADSVPSPAELSGETTWSLADSPRTITADVSVPAGARLVLEPGVEVRWMPGTTLRVEGSLHAVGTPADPIRFVPASANATGLAGAASWGGIEYRGGEGDRLEIVHATVRGARTGVHLAARTGSSYRLEHLLIEGTVDAGVRVAQTEHAGSTLRFLEFGVGEGRAVSVEAVNRDVHDLLLTDVQFRRTWNHPSGVVLVADASVAPVTVTNVQIRNATFFDAFAGIVVAARSSAPHTVALRSLVFANNTILDPSVGIRIVSDPRTTIRDWSVEGNRVVRSAAAGISLSLDGTVGPVRLANNTITDGRGNAVEISGNAAGIELRGNNWSGNSLGLTSWSGEGVDARWNYWGHGSGPRHPDRNPQGRGGSVHDPLEEVAFDPWLEAPPRAERPVARISGLAQGLDVSVTSRDSFDFDGPAVRPTWEWGDGSPPVEGNETTHRFGAGGLYAVRLRVVDDAGLEHAGFAHFDLKPRPANFSLENLSVDPPYVRVGRSVAVRADLHNHGDLDGTFACRLVVDGSVVASHSVDVPRWQSRTCRFDFTPDRRGIRDVAISGAPSVALPAYGAFEAPAADAALLTLAGLLAAAGFRPRRR